MSTEKDIIDKFERALIELNKIEAQDILNNKGSDINPVDLISRIVVPALENIGDSWYKGTLALSQVYMSGRICEQLIDDMLPPSSNMWKKQPKMAIAVLNDFHFLGKRIIHSHIRSAGYEIIDYGRKTVDELVESILKDKIEIIFISTLMYPSALDIKKVKEKLITIAPNVKMIVGGAPFNMDEKLWLQIGADAMGHNGGEALKLVKNLMEGKYE